MTEAPVPAAQEVQEGVSQMAAQVVPEEQAALVAERAVQVTAERVAEAV